MRLNTWGLAQVTPLESAYPLITIPPFCSHLLVKLLHGKCQFCYCSGVLTDFTDIQCAVHSRIWYPTPVLLPGKSHGPRSLISYSPWGREESDTTERLTHTHSQVTMVFCWISVVFPGHKLRLTIFLLVNFLIPFWHTSHREIITLVVSRHANMHVFEKIQCTRKLLWLYTVQSPVLRAHTRPMEPKTQTNQSEEVKPRPPWRRHPC